MDIVYTNATETTVTAQYTYAELVDKYSDSVYKFCRSLTYSKEDAEDLFQETFLKVFEQSNKPQTQSYIFSTALFTWKSWKRKYARRNRIATVEPLDEFIVGDTNIEDDYTAREEIQLTRKLVEALPEKFKIPVVMFYTLEMNVSDIALALKIPDGTVKSRLFNARKIIEKGLMKYEI